MKKVCVYGGGNLGHTVAGFLAANKDVEVSVCTRKPELWNENIEIMTPKGYSLYGKLSSISDSPDVITNSDIVILCLPGFSIKESLIKIKPYIKNGTIIGSVVSTTGFFFEAFKIFPKGNPLFGFQRVPFIARTIEYGQKAAILGFKTSLSVSIENSDDKEGIRCFLEKIFKTPVNLLCNYLEASLSNSNPILHPSRLYEMWKDWSPNTIYEKQLMFYEEWNDKTSEILISMDNEFSNLLNVLPVTPHSIPSILEYYESDGAESLTQKIKSINAFRGIKAPMKKYGNGYIPDFTSRYFTEDFPFGLGIIRNIAKENYISTPLIDKVYLWGMECINKYGQLHYENNRKE